MVRPEVRGREVPTFDEAVALIRGKAGHLSRAEDAGDLRRAATSTSKQLVAAALDKHGLRGPKADPKTPVILQTFGEASARDAGADQDRRAGRAAAQRRRRLRDRRRRSKAWKGIVQGFGPAKDIVAQQPRLREVGARRGHDGDAVHVPLVGHRGGLHDVAAEMAHYPLHAGRRRAVHRQPGQVPAEVDASMPELADLSELALRLLRVAPTSVPFMSLQPRIARQVAVEGERARPGRRGTRR